MGMNPDAASQTAQIAEVEASVAFTAEDETDPIMISRVDMPIQSTSVDSFATGGYDPSVEGVARATAAADYDPSPSGAAVQVIQQRTCPACNAPNSANADYCSGCGGFMT
jgi:hypothetical protein